MTVINSSPDLRDLLIRLGYNETRIVDILHELDTLFKEIEFEKIKQSTSSAQEAKDTKGLISSLKDLMILLENKGYYRPDAPTRLLMLLVNGLNLINEDIFAVLEKANIPEKEKSKEKDFLASCAAITQLGYILVSNLVSEVKAASAGAHVFMITEGFSPDSMIFIDLSIDSILEIDALQYCQKENFYYLKKPVCGVDSETSKLITQYYSFFQVATGIGLSHNIHNNLGITYDRIGRYEEAVEELKAALRLNPEYIEIHNNLAVTYDKMGRCEEAIEEIKEALRINPEYSEAHSNLGIMYARQGRYAEGIKELEEALRINPNYAPAHNALGNIYAEQKRDIDAIKEFHEALRINPSYAPAHNNLGNMLAELGRYQEALKEFKEALKHDPEFPEAYHGAGFVYYSLGSYERAVHAFVSAVYLAPYLLDSVPDELSLKVRRGVSGWQH